MKFENEFELMCALYALQGAEKVEASRRFRDGGVAAVVNYLAENGNERYAEYQFQHARAMGEERQKVFELMGKEEAARSAQTLKSRFYLGKRTKEGD